MSGPPMDARHTCSTSFRNQRDRRKSCPRKQEQRWSLAFPDNGGTLRWNVVADCKTPCEQRCGAKLDGPLIPFRASGSLNRSLMYHSLSLGEAIAEEETRYHCLDSVKIVEVVQTSPQNRWLERMLEQHVDGSVPRFFLKSSVCSGANASILDDAVEIVLWPRLPVSMLSFSGRGANGGCVPSPFQENYVDVVQLIPQERGPQHGLHLSLCWSCRVWSTMWTSGRSFHNARTLKHHTRRTISSYRGWNRRVVCR